MVIYQVSKESDFTIAEKIERINAYDTGELLRVVREFEDAPRKFEEEVMKEVYGRLFDKGIMCI